jgi:two-component system, OmpR family, KDP operon response regulator KdpE
MKARRDSTPVVLKQNAQKHVNAIPSAKSMSEHKRILVVDDEPQITRVLRTTFTAQGYDVRVANDGEMALEIMKDWSPDLIVTDLVMPNMDGVSLCRRVRSVSQMPIIVLSVRDQERAKVEALDAGADDYVTKPFPTNELVARVRANLRRTPVQTETVEKIGIGDFSVDLAGRQVLVRGEEVRLTPKEFELLVHLLQHARKVLTHRGLLTAVWGFENADQPEYLRVFIGQLRKKIEQNPSEPKYILTEPWVGYRFEPGGQSL